MNTPDSTIVSTRGTEKMPSLCGEKCYILHEIITVHPEFKPVRTLIKYVDGVVFCDNETIEPIYTQANSIHET